MSRGLASDLEEGHRCEFVLARAEDLAPVADESVDVVTTRSVVIYVEEKQRAFDEFHRVLKPGGRLSVFEPINRFGFPEPEGRYCGFDVSPVADLAAKVKGMEQRLADDATLVDFDERDLVAFAERAGFRSVELNYEARVEHGHGRTGSPMSVGTRSGGSRPTRSLRRSPRWSTRR